MAIKAVFALVFLLVMTLFTIWYERRVVAFMQHRKGPNMNGPFGLLQSLADGMKLMFKEDFTPKAADRVVFMLAPFVMAVPAITAFAVIPMAGPVPIPFTDIVTPLQVTDLPVSVLFIVAIASVGVYGIVLAGWSSGSTYALLGALRSSAQVISYEVAMGLALVAVFLYAGSLSTSEIVAKQAEASVRCSANVPVWFAVLLVAVVRDLSDLDGGRDEPGPVRPARSRGRTGRRLPHRVLLDAFRDVLHGRVHEHDHRFRVGHHVVPRRLACAAAVQPDPRCWTVAGGVCCGSCSRSWCMLFIFVWLRGTLPRLRYDQFMRFGWRWLIPISLVWIVIVSAVRVGQPRAGSASRRSGSCRRSLWSR